MYTSLWKFFLAGGFFMWPILFCSVMALAVAAWQLGSCVGFGRELSAFLRFLGSRGREGSGGLGGMDAGSFGADAAERLELAGERVQLRFDRVGKPLELISVLGGIAPLLGFLGTVSGMIAAFQSIAAADKVSVTLVAGGIAEAMITTGYGLCVAIPCMFAESWFRYWLQGKAHRATEELNETELRVRLDAKDAVAIPPAAGGPAA